MPKINLTPVEADYLREMYRARENSLEATTGHLAKTFEVKPASVVDVLKRMEDKKLVEKYAWGKVRLTKLGIVMASKIIHNHRILETYFNQRLEISSETACLEASKIDHVIGETVINKICEKLGFPTKCIHGLEVRHEQCRGK